MGQGVRSVPSKMLSNLKFSSDSILVAKHRNAFGNSHQIHFAPSERVLCVRASYEKINHSVGHGLVYGFFYLLLKIEI